MKQYHDPLHIPWETLTVRYDGQSDIILSKAFIDRQNAWLNLEEIKSVYWLKLCIYDIIEKTTDRALLRSYVKDLTIIEFEIQRLFGFSENSDWHRFWQTPKCECPVMDNYERYGSGYSVINPACPLHGD